MVCLLKLTVFFFAWFIGIKTEIDTPYQEKHDEGKIEFFIDCSANATPEFEGRGGEELALEISNTLQKAYQSSKAFQLKDLCILPRQQCWKLYVDILVSLTKLFFLRSANIQSINRFADFGVRRKSFRCSFTSCQSSSVQYKGTKSSSSFNGWRFGGSHPIR